MPATLDIVAPSRLHFGMFSFGHADVRQFGGVGCMIEQPGLHLRITPQDCFQASGPLAKRVQRIVEELVRRRQRPALPHCRIEVLAAPPEHVGLGTGTQLALAVVRGMVEFESGSQPTLEQLIEWSGRAMRSSIGSYGFVQGGLLIESGKSAGERLAPLEAQVALPDDWRFVLVYPRAVRGLSGEAELSAFRQLPPVPPAITAQLRAEVHEELLPAAQTGDFERFGRSLYRFGHTAGLCFAQQQAGAFATPEVGRLVATIREWGVGGAGQSSWGPAIFALLESPVRAEQFAERLARHVGADHAVIVARPNTTGARLARDTQDLRREN